MPYPLTPNQILSRLMLPFITHANLTLGNMDFDYDIDNHYLR